MEQLPIQTTRSRLFPMGFTRELKGLFTLAWPTSLSILFHYLIQPISLMFCGHLGKTQLASAAMAISVIYVTTVSVGRGLAFGGDTFFSQVYGTSNKKKVGVYLQKSILLGVLCCFPVWALLLNTQNILLLIGQDPEVAEYAQMYCLYFMPGCLAYCWLFTLMRYLLCQNLVIPNLIICVVSCAMNALLHYLLVYKAGLGIRGSAISLAATYYLVFSLLVAYIYCSGIYKTTWAGWTYECLDEWREFARVCLSSVFMTFLFWLCTEVGTYLAGLFGEKDISAFSIAFQVEGFAWMVPLGMGGACTARIGQYLGAKQPEGAVTACRVGFSVQVLISLAMAGVAYALRYYIPLAFTANKELVEYTGSVLSIVSIFLLLEGFGGVGMGIIRGTGRQTLGTVIIIISWYLCALPVGISLMFATHLHLYGLWWGFVLGLATQDALLVIFIVKINWRTECDKAQERAGLPTEVTAVNEDLGGSGQVVDESTGLLSGHKRSPHTRPSVLIARSVVIFLACALVLVAGLLVRWYVPVTVPMTSLCVPVNTTVPPPVTHSDEMLQYLDNSSLPFCNYTNAYVQYFNVLGRVH